MGDIIPKDKNIPAKIEELNRFVKMGRERHNARLAEIRAISDIPEAQEIREQLIEQTAEELGETWEAHGRIGQLIDEKVGGKGKYQSGDYSTLEKYNLTKDDSRLARGILAAIDANILSDLIDKMIRNKTILRYSALYNEWKKRQPKPETPPLPEGLFSVIH